MALDPRIREISKLVPGQSRLRGRSRRHPSLATDAQAWGRGGWGPPPPPPPPPPPFGASHSPAPPSLRSLQTCAWRPPLTIVSLTYATSTLASPIVSVDGQAWFSR